MAKIRQTISPSISNSILSQTGSDQKVRFSFKYCKLKSDFCLTELERGEIERFFKKLGDNEDLTIRQFCLKDRTQGGFSVYKKDSASYKKLSTTFPEFDLFGHFWITGVPTRNTFRIMGTQKNETIYILLIDYDGKIDNDAHK